MITFTKVIDPEQILFALNAVNEGHNLQLHIFDILCGMGLVENEFINGLLCDVLTEAGKQMLEGQGVES